MFYQYITSGSEKSNAFLDGSGSVLNIELQSDITLKHDQVIIEVDGGYNYGIMEIYGLVGYNEVDIKIFEEGNTKNE